jgi:hypothetical protein
MKREDYILIAQAVLRLSIMPDKYRRLVLLRLLRLRLGRLQESAKILR